MVAGYKKRIFAFLIDLVMIFALAIAIFYLITKPIMNLTSAKKECLQQYEIYNEQFKELQDEFQVYIYDSAGRRVFNQDLTEIEEQAFLNDERVIKVKEILQPLADKKSGYDIFEFFVSLIFSSTIFILIIPLYNNGRTIAKKLFELKVIKKDGTIISKKDITLRYFIQLIIEILLGVITVGMVPLISLFCCILTLKSQSIPDIICKTIVIENKKKLK